LIVRQPPSAVRLANNRNDRIASCNGLFGLFKGSLRVCALLKFGAGLLVLRLASLLGADTEQLQQAGDDGEDRAHGSPAEGAANGSARRDGDDRPQRYGADGDPADEGGADQPATHAGSLAWMIDARFSGVTFSALSASGTFGVT